MPQKFLDKGLLSAPLLFQLTINLPFFIAHHVKNDASYYEYDLGNKFVSWETRDPNVFITIRLDDKCLVCGFTSPKKGMILRHYNNAACTIKCEFFFLA